MHKLGLDGILAGSALALVLATAAVADPEAPAADTAASIESRIPVPQPVEVKPPTRADLDLAAKPDSGEGVPFPDTEHAPAAEEHAAGVSSQDGSAPSGASKPDSAAAATETRADGPGAMPPTPATAADGKPPEDTAATSPKGAPERAARAHPGADVPAGSA